MSNNKTTTYKFAILLLSVFLLVILLKSYKDNKSATDLQLSLKQESTLTQNQLSEILVKYDSVNSIYNSYDDGVTKINNSSNKFNTKITNLSDLNSQINSIKDSILLLKEKIKILEALKTKLSPIEKITNTTSKTIIENTNNNFVITNLQVKGVKFFTENAVNKSKAIEQIRVCFSLEKNLAIPSGNKELFIQVINPKNNIISVNNLSYENNNSILKYSKIANFNYKQNTTDVCSYVDLEKNKTVKGKYLVNIYSGTNKIGSTIFNYN